MKYFYRALAAAFASAVASFAARMVIKRFQDEAGDTTADANA
ncbi:MAG: hypothetical protein AAF291_09885 [Pseudomonadota bacterium]